MHLRTAIWMRHIHTITNTHFDTQNNFLWNYTKSKRRSKSIQRNHSVFSSHFILKNQNTFADIVFETMKSVFWVREPYSLHTQMHRFLFERKFNFLWHSMTMKHKLAPIVVHQPHNDVKIPLISQHLNWCSLYHMVNVLMLLMLLCYLFCSLLFATDFYAVLYMNVNCNSFVGNVLFHYRSVCCVFLTDSVVGLCILIHFI